MQTTTLEIRHLHFLNEMKSKGYSSIPCNPCSSDQLMHMLKKRAQGSNSYKSILGVHHSAIVATGMPDIDARKKS